MKVYPAIDIRRGKCVRLTRGDYDAETVYEDDPLEVAERFVKSGIRQVHIIDLDGAKDGVPVNLELISELVKLFKTVDGLVSLGGGIRDQKIFDQYSNIGVDRVYAGTALVRALLDGDPLPVRKNKNTQVYASLDIRGDTVRVSGWLEESGMDILRAVRELAGDVDGYLITAIERDGTLSGPDIELMRKVDEVTTHPFLAAGGIGSSKHIYDLARSGMNHLEGVVVGKALYEGKVTLEDVLSVG